MRPWASRTPINRNGDATINFLTEVPAHGSRSPPTFFLRLADSAQQPSWGLPQLSNPILFGSQIRPEQAAALILPQSS
jgi:hypothetical protein